MRSYVKQYNKMIAKGEARFRLTLYIGLDNAAAWFDRAATVAANAGDTQRELIAKWSAVRCVRYHAVRLPYMWEYVDRDYRKLLELIPAEAKPGRSPVRQGIRLAILREYAEVKQGLGGSDAVGASVLIQEATNIELALANAA